MIRKLLLLLLFSITIPALSQVRYQTIQSRSLNTTREIKIQLPRNYETNTGKVYPLILVLDGDYMFEPMAGSVDLLSYWNEMPEAIVVGINQSDYRKYDTYYETLNYLPAESGEDFFEFIGMELVPSLKNKFRISDFLAIAGHDATANFVNYYLFKNEPLFDAYINLSPELAPRMAGRLVNKFKRNRDNLWFYLATSTGDDESLNRDARFLNEELSTVENESFHYRFDHLGEVSHFALIGQAIPLALHSIFKDFRPITMREYEEDILTSKLSPVDYLLNKYKRLEKNFEMDITIRVSDFLAIGRACETLENWKELERLGKLASKHYPKSMLGTYYQAKSLESIGKPEKAMKMYKMAYGKEEVAFITTDYMIEKAEQIKKDFNYL